MMAWSKGCTSGLLRFWLCGLACLLLGGVADASSWYAAPSGTPSGNGSIASPWNLDTAETKPLQPGDTLWLRGGTYESTTGGYNFVFNGSATAPIVVRNYNHERVTIDGTAREFSLSVNGSYIWVWGLEFEDLHPNGRTVSVPGSGNQDQIQLGYGPSIYGPNNKFINCIVHNTAQGFSGYAAAPNLEVYGNLSYYNGYIAPDRNHGHGVYMQNTTGTKLIADNIVGDNADEGIQVYGNSGPLIGITLQGNTAYNTSSWPTPNYQANILMGGGGAIYGNSILQNMSFFTLSAQYGSIDIGQYTGSYDIDVEQNVFAGGSSTVAVEGINSPFTFVKNTMVNLPTGYNSTVQEQVIFGQYSGQNTSGYTWDNNSYYGTNLFYGGVYNGSSLANGSAEPFSVWRTSAFDNHSTFTPALPTGKWIYVRANKYETKRANITVYNWDAYNASGNVVLGKSPSVQVDLSSVLTVGDQFVIQDAQNFFGPAVVSGTYAGGTVTIPMEGLAKEVPIGFAAPAHTAPAFGAFIVMVPGAANAVVGSSTSPGTPAPTVPAPSPAVCPCTIWSSGALPGNIDSGSGPGVELGVKFRSDVSGTITGLRFYKSAANTGTHIGNLWSSSGTLLATATFTSETASGWQQVSFSSPVAITANTVYVASYHTSVGHFSYDLNAFASAGVDNSPLHALQNGVSGGDGVYMYGATSAFPSSTYESANYWVDVVFSTTTAASTPTTSPSLVSIAVTPANASVNVGATRQFVATGTYQDASTQNLSTQVTWNSSNTTIATVSSGGLATGKSAGSSNITAALNSITSPGVSLSVQTAPAPAASLVSVTVSPSSATVQPGTVQQFTATGYYSNGNIQDLTNSVNWNSSSTSVATLNGSGLASVQGPGSTVISASISGSATITGQASVSSGTSSTLPSGLLLHWTFDSTSISGNTLTDSSPNNQAGTIHGNAVSVAGVLGQALQFDGSSNYVTTSTGAAFTGSITLAAWIKTTNQSRPEAIISRYDAAGSGTGYIFRTDAAGHLEVVFGGANGGSINSPAVDTAVINDGQWHHALAVITVGQGVQFYVDGKPTAYVPQSFWAADASGYFYVGLNSFTYFGNFFTGSIDEVQAYNRALSPSEANTVYLLSGGH